MDTLQTFFWQIRFFIITMFYDISISEGEIKPNFFSPRWKTSVEKNTEGYWQIANKSECHLYADKDGCSCIETIKSYPYGIARALIRFSNVKGNWGGFWTLDGVDSRFHPEDGKILPEYDFECCGSWLNKVTATWHHGPNYFHPEKRQSKMNNIRGGFRFKPTKKFYWYEIDHRWDKIIWRINKTPVKISRKYISTHLRQVRISNLNPYHGNYCGDEIERGKMEIVNFYYKKHYES